MLLNELHQILELLVRFARKAGDEGRPDREVIDSLAKRFEQMLSFAAGYAAGHALQHRVVGML